MEHLNMQDILCTQHQCLHIMLQRRRRPIALSRFLVGPNKLPAAHPNFSTMFIDQKYAKGEDSVSQYDIMQNPHPSKVSFTNGLQHRLA